MEMYDGFPATKLNMMVYVQTEMDIQLWSSHYVHISLDAHPPKNGTSYSTKF